MNKNQKPNCEKVVSVQEKDLRSAQGGDQHVDNPGQTPMKDGDMGNGLLAFPFIQTAMQGPW